MEALVQEEIVADRSSTPADLMIFVKNALQEKPTEKGVASRNLFAVAKLFFSVVKDAFAVHSGELILS